MLIEIHMLQNHAPSNLNRDDTGSPKECMFGGVSRSRISSQCLKHSIRASPVFKQDMNGVAMGIRTRYLPELVRKKLLGMGIDEHLADVAANVVVKLGKKDKSAAGGKEEAGEESEETEEEGEETEEESEGEATEPDAEEEQKKLRTKQIMFLVDEEVQSIAEVIKAKLEEKGEAFGEIKGKEIDKLQTEIGEEMSRTITPDVALFGRMITSSAFKDVEAAIHVAHAISTNRLEREFDFFTAVDDLQKKGEVMGQEKGASMMGDVEFNSACYYKYFSLDCDQFVDNMAGDKGTPDDRAAAIEMLEKIIHAFLRAAAL